MLLWIRKSDAPTVLCCALSAESVCSSGVPAPFCFLPSGSGGKETKMQGYNDFSRKKAWEDPNCPCFLSEDGKYYCYRVWDSELKRVVIEKHEVGKGEYTEDITLILADTDHDHYLNERYQNELKDPLFQKKLSDREGLGNAEGEDAPDPWDDRRLSSKGPEDTLFAEPEKENPQVAKVREVLETQFTDAQKDFYYDHFGMQKQLEEMRQAEEKDTGKLVTNSAMNNRKNKMLDKVAKALGTTRVKRHKYSKK